ncbi:helix-turn-helix domain-containing protein [Actinomadura rudentiformis]|uniref:Helix-turn-helix transcriptional regulator n=1 Tax=Actinomadura rudentiformis TaxID=359158 RepID=A0A6H9YXC4_9ACTN|nr:helix-turn-helix transcriptional regulator [Actinomadura rudentiformis]KAB2344822.1 helix-turn-helix transcriptional regulator [Actinomadura rudentiformis]
MDATNPGESFATWLREQMTARGYQLDGPRAGGPSRLAREIGVHRASVGRMLNRGVIPKLETLEAIATQFKIPRSDVLTAAGLGNESTSDAEAPAPATVSDEDPDPNELFTGGLRDQHERAIWAMVGLPWQARQAAIEAVRTEARRMAAESAAASKSVPRSPDQQAHLR